MSRRGWPGIGLVFLLFLGTGCADRPEGAERVEVRIPRGAGALEVARQLEDAELIGAPRIFALYVALRGAEGELRSGRYRLQRGASWATLLETLERGAVETREITVPEGFTLREIAPRVAALSEVSPDSVLALARDPALADSLAVPGPTLEGYLFPETYRFAEEVPPRRLLGAMAERYRAFWGPEERRRAREIGLSEREVVTLASIVEEEARHADERAVIAGVYHNRLERGMRLEADPTVQYALGAPRERLLYRDIDRVADHPYNTYTHAGLPPGPIASPGAGSLRAALWPADVPYLYFVARPDGSHVFTETHRAHVNAKNRIRRRRDAAPRPDPGDPGEG